jgi:RTX calcium-binding nonapeptide repeat (4 copies)
MGSAGADRLGGTPGSDVIVAGSGNDRVVGGGGNDLICAGSGNDRVVGDGGNGRAPGDGATARLAGSGGRDIQRGGTGNDRLYGQGGNDRLAGGGGHDLLRGGRGDDRLLGDGGADGLFGGPGRDRLHGGLGDDRLLGGPGADRFRAGPGEEAPSDLRPAEGRKVEFLDLDRSGPCVLPPGTGRPGKSSAIINRNPAGTEVTVQLQLQDALPNTTYTVGVWENDCEFGDFFPVTTNDQGNASGRLTGFIGGFPPVPINDVSLTADARGPSSDSKQTPKVTFGP